MTRDTHAEAETSGTDPSGWIEAGLFVLAVSALNVLYAYAAATGAHVTVFVLVAMAATAAAMLALSGMGGDAKSVIAHRASWVYGIASVGLEAIYFVLVGITSPAEASLTARLSVPASLLVGRLVFRARLTPGQVAGALVVIAAVVPIFAWVAPEHRDAAIWLGTACALTVAIKTYASEYHPWNRRTTDVTEKIRITGLVVLATTVLGAGVTAAAMQARAAGLVGEHALIPAPADFAHLPTLALALLAGAPILFAMSYLTFSSVVKIGTPNFLATSAVTPLTAYAMQLIAAATGLIVAPRFDATLLAPILAGIAGVLLIVWSGNRRRG